jgi:hypothetical protein
MKFFNTAGPVNPKHHYCLPPAIRLDEQELRTFIEQQKYFILHAPRQTGKTSTMRDFVRRLNTEGKYSALYFNVEPAQACRGNFEQALPVILQEMENEMGSLLSPEDPVFKAFDNLKTKHVPSGSFLTTFLKAWCVHASKPIVLFIDEIDSLIGDTLLSVLRQLRAGYPNRPQEFPQSVCLIGVRDGSAFNIKSKSIRMNDFTFKQVQELYQQHTVETEQIFENAAIDYAFEVTQGQPWLVNALADEACFTLQLDRKQAITQAILEQAKENIIKRRETHLDVLVDRLQEPRVRKIIDAIITGVETSEDFPLDDIQYVFDLGLVARRNNNYVIANPIYQEVLPRELTYSTQMTMPQQPLWYVNSDGSLNMPKMLTEFTQFYRENSAIWLEKFAYKESGPHLFIMAFLQRIINGGGKINREYALGTDRVDLLILWKTQRIVIELKVWHSQKKTVIRGLDQTAGYMDTAGATEGHLVIFDKQEKSWDEKIYTRQEHVNHHTITVWGM